MALTVEFFNVDAGETNLDTEIFLDDRTNAGAFNLASLETEDILKAGSYPIKYRVYHTLYTSNIVILNDPFVISIGDPCDLPINLTASDVSDQEYTITDGTVLY